MNSAPRRRLRNLAFNASHPSFNLAQKGRIGGGLSHAASTFPRFTIDHPEPAAGWAGGAAGGLCRATLRRRPRQTHMAIMLDPP